MIHVVKKAIRNILVVLEHTWFVSPRNCRFSLWHEDGGLGSQFSSNLLNNPALVAEQPEWAKVERVGYSGVCVLSKAKVLMCRPWGCGQDNTGYRKAIVFAKNYRPLKYPGSKSLLVSFGFLRSNVSMFFKKKHRVARLSGRVVLLGNHVFYNTNYFHFLADVVGDIWYINKIMKSSEFPDFYLVPFAGLPWQWDILHLCGLGDDQVIPYSRYDILSFEKLIIPVRDKRAGSLSSWLSSAIHQMSGWTPRKEKGERLIFVSRADASRRRVVNEAAIRERLVQEGFEVHTLEGLSFREQQSLFASAAIICAPHGAALTNLVWCGPGTVVIEFLSEQHLNPCFKDLAEQNQVIYYPFVCTKVENDDAGIKGDITVSDAQVDSVLNIVAKHSSLSA